MKGLSCILSKSGPIGSYRHATIGGGLVFDLFLGGSPPVQSCRPACEMPDREEFRNKERYTFRLGRMLDTKFSGWSLRLVTA